MSDEIFEISITYFQGKSGAPLLQAISCDRSTAIDWLRAVAEELEAERERAPEEPKPPRPQNLRIGGHPQSLRHLQ